LPPILPRSLLLSSFATVAGAHKPNILFADDQRADTVAARHAKPEPPVAKRTRIKTPRNPHRETALSRAHANAVSPAPIDEMI